MAGYHYKTGKIKTRILKRKRFSLPRSGKFFCQAFLPKFSASITILTLILQIFAGVLLLPAREAQAHSWLSGFGYRKQITITGQSGAGTNYQVKLLVGETSGASGEQFDLAGHCTSFPNDIKFTASDGSTELSYWVESTSGTTPNRLATIWVKVTADLGSNQNIYIYYGKSGQSNSSNGNNTFLVFDDFNDGSLDTNKWKTNTKSGTTISETSGNLQFNLSGTYTGGCILAQDAYALPSGSYAVETEAMQTDFYANGAQGTYAGFTNNTTSFDFSYGNPSAMTSAHLRRWSGGSKYLAIQISSFGSYVEGTTAVSITNIWFKVKMTYTYTASPQVVTGVFTQLSSPFSSVTLNNSGTGGIQPIYVVVGSGDYYIAKTAYINYVLVRKYTSTEPAYSSASAEQTNTAPSAPSSLGPAAYVNGSWGTNTQPTLQFTQSDADSGETVKYSVQIDDTSNFSSPVVDYTSALMAQGATSFTVGQAAGSGSYTTGNESQTLTTNTSYYWRVMTTDEHDGTSSWATANSGAIAFSIDTSAPSTPAVTDDGTYTTSTTQLHATWSSTDSESGIADNQYCISSHATDCNTGQVVDWTSAAATQEVTKDGLTLSSGTTYYFHVKTQNNASTWSDIGHSNGIMVDSSAPSTPAVTDDGTYTTSTT